MSRAPRSPRPPSSPRAPAAVPGLPARHVAADILANVLRKGRPLDEQIDGHQGLATLDPRDRALARQIVGLALRRLGTLRFLLGEMLPQGLPDGAPAVESALLTGAVQILWMDVPDHAAVDLAVRLVRTDRRGLHFAGLVNAVLRRIAREGAAMLADADTAALDTPPWLMARWTRSYGAETALAIAAANAHEPALDLSVKADAAAWAEKLGGRLTPTGTVRLAARGTVAQLDGFAEGAWWVQDAAAALPARLLGDVAGRSVADLCAAPGGKTAQLAAAGAIVTAVDRSAPRLERLAQNLARLGLSAETVVADATQWAGAAPFDAVLLDAPCSATGTIRRHPDIPWLKGEADIAALAALQRRLLAHAASLVKPGGAIVYCTCSLEDEEGPGAVADVLAATPGLRRAPIRPDEIAGESQFITPDGDLRTLPCHWPDPEPRMAGLDGFFAARLVRAG